MRCLIVGFGSVAEGDHCPAYSERGVDVIAVVDPTGRRRAQARRLFPACRTYPDLETALTDLGDQIDFCDVAAPPYAHAEAAIQCINAGIPVLCEKPIAVSRNELERLVERVRSQGVPVFPCHTWQHAPQIIEMLDCIRQGDVGEPRHVTVDIQRTAPARGIDDWRPEWRTSADVAGGGILFDHGYHAVYLVQRLLSAVPVAVTVERQITLDDAIDAETILSLALEPMSSPGTSCSARISLTWRADRRITRYRVVGSRGAIEATDDQLCLTASDTRRWVDKAGGLTATSRHPGWFARMFDDIRPRLQSRDDSYQCLKDACLTMEVLWLTHRSGSSGGPYPIPLSAWLASDDTCQRRR